MTMTIERAKLRGILIELFRSDKKLMTEVVEEVNKQDWFKENITPL